MALALTPKSWYAIKLSNQTQTKPQIFNYLSFRNVKLEALQLSDIIEFLYSIFTVHCQTNKVLSDLLVFMYHSIIIIMNF